MKQIPALTCCRALFAGWVFTYHLDLQSRFSELFGPAAPVVREGALGVDGFFILSGLVLAYAHPALAARSGEIRAFLAKRLLRIYPVHLAVIGLFCLLLGGAALLGQHPREPERFGLAELWRHLLLVHAWGASDRWAWNYPSWSISAEWAGYLAFPFLWPVLRDRRAVSLTGVLALAAAGVVIAQMVRVRLGISLTYDGGLLRFFPEFIAGMATVPLVRRVPAGIAAPAVAAAGVAAVAGGVLIGRDAVAIFGLWLALAGMLLGAAQGRASRLAQVPGLHRLGEVSYSFYMSFAVAETVQATLWRALSAAPVSHRLVYVVTTTGLTLGLGTALWALVERPALRLYRWRGRAVPAVPAVL